MDQEQIGKFIAELRKEKNLTQQALANKLGITDRAVSKWENGRNLPDLSLLIPLSKELEISVNELLLGKRIQEDVMNETYEQNLVHTIQYSTEKMQKNKKNYHKIVLLFLSFVLLLVLFTLQVLNPWIVLVWTLSYLGIFIHQFMMTKRKFYFLPIIIIGLFIGYSFFTYSGAVRLQIALMGHPIEAYQTKLNENKNYHPDDNRYFIPEKNIQVVSGSMGHLKCENYFGIKIASYYGF